MDKATYLDFVIEVINRSADQKGFRVLPRRLLVECTFDLMTLWPPPLRDYHARKDISQAMIIVAMSGKLLRSNTNSRPLEWTLGAMGQSLFTSARSGGVMKL